VNNGGPYGSNKIGKVVCIIQARMGSSRLPGKVLADIARETMLWHVVSRVRKASLLEQAVVAIPDRRKDEPLADFCKNIGADCFNGSEIDVLDRYFQAAKKSEAELIVRVTADCPFINPKGIDAVVSSYLKGRYDYVHNKVDCSTFSFKSLK